MQIQISNLNSQTTQENIRILFAKYNNVSVGLVRSIRSIANSGASTFAYVDMDNDFEAEQAIHTLNGCLLDGKKVKIEKAN
jgi:hypothetical protein